MKTKFFLGLMAVVAILITAILNEAVAASSTLAAAGMIASSRQRQIYDNVAAKYPGKTIVPGFLRVEKAITNSIGSYNINFTQDTNATRLTEQKLTRNERFLITHIGFALMKEDSTVPYIGVDQTYPNVNVFAAGTAFLAAHLEVFYKGMMALKVNSKEFIRSLEMKQFRAVGAMAQSSATTYSEINAEMGFVELTPNVRIDGDVDHNLTISIPLTEAHKVANDVANMTNYLVVIARGFLIKE